MKKILRIQNAPNPHWVGDGFPVRSMFSYDGDTSALSPFLLLDYAGPVQFAPASRPRGVGEHPHRGFETVTIVYEGEVEHRDSSGGGGKIGPGDVQWMTAGCGILHDEFHSHEFTCTGGMLEMVENWPCQTPCDSIESLPQNPKRSIARSSSRTPWPSGSRRTALPGSTSTRVHFAH